MSKIIEATWSISLDCECPHCKKDVDLTNDNEFWIDSKFVAGEWGTDKTRNVEVICPECGGEFQVDFVY